MNTKFNDWIKILTESLGFTIKEEEKENLKLVALFLNGWD